MKNVTAGSAALTGYVPSSTNPVANVTVNPYVAGTTLTSAGTAPSVTGQTLQQYADGTIASNVKYDEVPSGYQQVNISTQAQYNQLVNEIKNGRQTSDMYVKLDGNIMVDQSISKFEGIFDGNGYSITMKDYGSDLFTNLDSATVQNLKVNNGSLASTATNSEIYGVSTSSGGQYYDSVKGGLIDTATNCKIVNCNTVGAIQGASTVSANIGGLIGEDNGSTIYSSSARVELNVYATSGGNYGLLVGRANGTKLYNTTASAAINVHESSGPTSSNYNLFGFSNGVTNNTLATTPLTSYTLTGSDEQIKQYLAYEYANGNSETYNTNLTKMSSLNTSRLASMLNSYQSKGKSTYATLDDLIKEGLLIPIAAKKSCTYSVSEGASETRGSVDINYDKDSTAKYIAYTAANKSGNTTNYETFYNVIKGYSDERIAELAEKAQNNSLTSSDITNATATTYTSDKYDINFGSANYSVAPQYASAVPATVESFDDIYDKLAYSIYQKNPSTTPDVIKNSLNGKFNNVQLASLNYYYNNENAVWNNIVNALSSNINADLSSYDLNKYSSAVENGKNNLQIKHTPASTGNGTVTTPSLNAIAKNVVIAMRQAYGETIDDTTATALTNKLTSIYGVDNQENNRTLANINDLVYNYINNGSNTSDIQNLYNFLNGSTTTLNITEKYDSSANYTYERSTSNVTPSVTYGTKNGNFVQTGEDFDTDSDVYKRLVNEYNAQKAMQDGSGRTYVIIPEEYCNKASLVSNYLNGGCYLQKFNKEKDGSYKMVDTNVSVETHLREVNDETNLKKAEAKYEADMKRIDLKDRKYDTDLAAMETERNAIKEEMETLKTVAKDNVERTFKLFS